MRAYDVFSSALELHKSNQFSEAAKKYQALYADDQLFSQLVTKNQEAVVLNLSSLLRRDNLYDQAISLLKSSLLRSTNTSFSAAIHNNLGNCFRDKELWLASVKHYRSSLSLEPYSPDARLSLSQSLTKLKYYNLAYKLLKDGFYLNLHRPSIQLKFLQPLANALINLKPSLDEFDSSLNSFVLLLEDHLPRICSDKDSLEASIFTKIFIGQFYLGLKDLNKALSCRDEIVNLFAKLAPSSPSIKSKFIETWNTFCWNLSIYLLKSGDLQNGWRLFDHGLQVPTGSKQKWQRALAKPFDFRSLPLWRGESLAGKHLLLLGEQGIGDSMMFLSLLPCLIDESLQISLFVEKRLRPIYQRSFPEINIVDEKYLASVSSSLPFDFQIPLGSICQHRFPTFDDYGNSKSILSTDRIVTNEFRKRHYDGRPLVGISWQGGGNPKIISQKTLPLKLWKPILSNSKFKFVSLQYGDDYPHIQRFCESSGLKIHHDHDVDPSKDMDRWLSQVDAMDCVVSVANTTIHGAGNLNKRTFCFLGNESDWRWTDQEVFSGSYWYPSVTVGMKDLNNSWEPAIMDAFNWLETTV